MLFIIVGSEEVFIVKKMTRLFLFCKGTNTRKKNYVIANSCWYRRFQLKNFKVGCQRYESS